MSSWMNDAPTVNVNGNGFPHINDPSHNAGVMMDPAAFIATNPAQGFNPAQPPQQFANPQQQQQMMAAMQNGGRNPSPSFNPNQQQQNPMYQTNSVIPSKRPRPREDSIASSPRPNPNMLPTSRAETPQQAGFQQSFQQPPQQQQNPTGQPQYPHLQPNGTSNATPSPIMANQLRPGSVPQRVSTASPHPFSPASQQFPQPSPVPSEHGGTPQPNPYMQNNSFQPGYGGAPSPARPSPSPNPIANQMMHPQMGQIGQMPGPGQMNQMGQMGHMQGPMPGQMPSQMPGQMPNQQMMAQMQQLQMHQLQSMQMQQQLQAMQMQGASPAQIQAQQQKLMYQKVLQQQMQSNMQMGGQMQNQGMPQNRGQMVGKQPGQQMPNGQQGPPHMRPQQPNRNINPEAFMKNLTAFMTAKGKQLNPNPIVDNRPTNLLHLFQVTMSRGGYKNTTANNGWVHIANMLGYPPAQHPTAGQQLKGHFEANLLEFEIAWSSQQSAKKGMPNQPGNAQGMPAPPQTPVKQMTAGQMSPTASQTPQGPQSRAPTPAKQMPAGPQQASVNGFSTPQPPHAQPQPPNTTPKHHHNNLSRSAEPSAHPEFAQPVGHPVMKPGIQPHAQQAGATPTSVTTARFPAPFSKDPDAYLPCSREVSTHGGFELIPLAKLGDELELYRPDAPRYNELGNIDISALTRSLQCGIHGEVRLALDTLATISGRSPMMLELSRCEDLLEAMIDCAEEQVDMLVENTVEVSDEILINSYEDVARACRIDTLSIRVVHIFGTEDYELDRAVDRLVCLTTILRNLSFVELNFKPLAEDYVIKFLCVVIRYLGSRNMLLRKNSNTLDFMKDIVILLSNIAHEIELPGKEQALCLLQFLLAFAPAHVATTGSTQLYFASYEPALQPYLPAAVDSLAKLFARDEPNRRHYKSLFATDASSSPPYELLTRTFALAISPIPDQTRDAHPQLLDPITKAREAFLMQGLLAADIIASIAPGYDSGLTRTWLGSGTGFAQNLFRLIRILSSQFEGGPAGRPGGRGRHNKDDGLIYMVRLGMSMLRKLSEKAKDPNDPVDSIPPNVVPSRDTVYGALQMQSNEWHAQGILKEIIAYAALEE
ncbi:putative arid bright dna binding domain-containing protein [Zalerion maritima]|uniref:Arid bright dna binding domain-containing protein n=1 Tax=Zalerion maritima TaxID=339359 RepID=A0AAD5RI66_9PEZI|nr:putative arid bright dna binding domain-containing protein [Zalerion maritima]